MSKESGGRASYVIHRWRGKVGLIKMDTGGFWLLTLLHALKEEAIKARAIGMRY